MISAIGAFGAGSVGVTPAPTCTLTTTVAIEAGNVAFIWWSSNNSSTADGATSEHTSLTDSAGAVSWVKLIEYCNANGAADAGITTSLWYRAKQGTTLASGSVITGTRVDARADQTMLSQEVSCTYDLIDDTPGPVGNVTDGSNGFGSVAFSGLANVERLYLRGLGKKANVANTTDITPSSGFTSAGATRSRNNAAATLARGEYRVATSTGETSDPTFAFTGDTAAVFVGLIEDAPAAYTLTAEAGTFALTGQAAGLRVARTLAAGAASYTLTGTATGLRVARRLSAGVGTFALTGNATGLRVARRLLAAAEGFTLVGQAAGLYAGRRLLGGSGAYGITGPALRLPVARRLPAAVGAYTLSGFSALLPYSSGSAASVRQYLVRLVGLDRFRITDLSRARYLITELPMTTTASPYLWITEDQEPDFKLVRKGALGAPEAATGITGATVHLAETPGGVVIGTLTYALTERGTTGIYRALMDTAGLVSGLSTYRDGTVVYLVVRIPGDVEARNFSKIIRRQRTGDG